jgi:hypothetical protein
MSRSTPPVSPEVRALLDQERNVPRVPAQVRKRALARARAALVAGRVTVPSSFPAAPKTRWGVAVAIACLASVAAAATAYEIGARRRPAPAEGPSAPVIHLMVTSQPPAISAPSLTATSTATPTVAPPPPPAPSPDNGVPHASQTEPGPDELRLLGQARAAVARHDFAAALVPIAEHARRFKTGRLMEEREALRVKALSGLGRTEEARRAADSFEARFPRSVLLPSVSKMPASQP